MRSMLDQIFKYRMGMKVAFRDGLTKDIQYGTINNRWMENKMRLYRVETDGLVSICVNEWNIIGFLKTRDGKL